LLNADGTNGETLKLTTGEEVDVTVHDVTKLERLDGRLQISQSVAALKELLDRLGALDGPRDLVDVLGLDNGFQVIFQQLGEVVYASACQF
jgi:hypothetical protein